MNLQLNEHVNAALTSTGSAYVFTPDDGYALWRDDETSNMDENGEPIHYWLTIGVPVARAEARAPHIWAKLIDDTMEVYGKTDPNEPELMTLSLDEEPSHTYIDENGVERPKKGVY